MAIEIRMPASSPGMSEGTLVRWLKREGDTVSVGDILAEIETDKAVVELEAMDEGVLGQVLVPDGSDHVAVDTPIALLLQEGESAAESGSSQMQAASAKTAPTSAEQDAPDEPTETRTGNTVPRPDSPQAGAGRIFASPLARRLSKEYGIDLAALKGSGPRGRIVRVDVETAQQAIPQQAISKQATLKSEERTERIDNNAMRRTIARRLSESKQQIPHFYLTVDCDVEKLQTMRARFNARGEEATPSYRLSVNDIVVCAVARALRRVPEVNASWGEQAITRYLDVHVCVAVSTSGGLLTPVIREADRKGLVEISSEIRGLAENARSGQLEPSSYQGGGFTISNLGMHGIREFSAIINPPQSAILAVGAVEKRPVVRGDELAVGTMMTMTLSADHRVIDGAVGARFMSVLRDLLEDPLNLLL
jgi:pyruvate dehydrogenase E2 component (dihydrolipoamide acetyltransferase)